MTTSRPASKPKVMSRSSTVVETVIFERDARPGKHPFGILEAQAMLCEVLPVLRFVPFVFQFPM
jgi:hypothetical protein